MTVATEIDKSGPYAGAGTTGPFTVGFRFLDNTHLQVIRTDAAGVDTTLAYPADYAVTGVGNPTGTVTTTVAVPAGDTLTIIRNVPFTQEADYVQNDDFPAESHETALDKLTMQTQQLKEGLSRALVLSPTVPGVSTQLPPPEAFNVIGWNEAEDALRNFPPSEIATIVAYGTWRADQFAGNGVQTVFTLTGIPGVIANLDISIAGVTQRPGADYTYSSGTTLTMTAPVPNGAVMLVRYGNALATQDSVLRAELAAPGGAALIGLQLPGLPATTVELSSIDVWKSVGVSYSNLGAVLDGVTDDTAAVAATHALAKSLGIKIRQRGGVAKVSGAATIEFATDCEFTGGFKFLFENPGTGFLFDVTPEYTPIELAQSAITISQFAKGTTVIPSLSAYKYHYAVIESAEVALIRTNGNSELKKSVTVIGEGGRLLYPLTFTFGSITKITLSPINISQRLIAGLAFEIKGTSQFALPIRQTRNNVKYTQPRYIDGGNTGAIPVRQMFTILNCFNTELENPLADTLSPGRADYNYVIATEGAAYIRASRLVSFEGWATFDGNNTRDVKVTDSTIYRGGGHFNCWDYSFENITSHSSAPFTISGGGRLDIKNIKLMPSAIVSGGNAIVDVRQDYGAQWDGDITVSGVTIDMTGCTTAVTLYGVNASIDSVASLHDFGVNLVLPRSITVEDVSILLNEANANAQHFQAVRIGSSGAIAGGRSFAYPKKVSVSNIKKVKASKTVNNEVNAFYLLGSTPSLGVSNEMHVHIEDVDRDDPRFASLNPYDSGQSPSVTIPVIAGLTVTLEVNDCLWARVDFSATGYAKITNSQLAAISGAGKYELYDCQYPATAFSGTWKGVMAGGVIRRYVGTDAALKATGFPNYIETNVAAARGVFVEKDGSIRSLTQTLSTIQTGFYDVAYYVAP